MIIVNLTDVSRSFYFDGTIVDIPSNGESADIILTESNLRAIMMSAKPSEVKFKVTSYGVDDRALANIGANVDYLYKEEVKPSVEEVKVEEIKVTAEEVVEEVKETKVKSNKRK